MDPLQPTTISAADFRKLLEEQGTDLRRVRVPRSRTAQTTTGGYDPDDPRLRQSLDLRAGQVRAHHSSGGVGVQLSLRAGPGRTPVGCVSSRDGVTHAFLCLTAEEARLVAAQILWAADMSDRDREKSSD